MLVHIYFDDADFVAQHLFYLFEYRMYAFTKATPSGIEIHKRERFTIYNVVECFHTAIPDKSFS